MSALGLVAGAEPASAQVLSASTALSLVEHRVDAGYGVERASGAVLGIGARAHLGSRFAVGIAARGGSLEARTVSAVTRDLGEVSVEARGRPLAWLAIVAGVARRAYSTDIAVQRWTMVSIGSEARLGLTGARAAGVIRAAWLPAVAVNGLERPGLALATAVGMEYRWGSVAGELFYELERCDFPPQAGVRRREQLSALTLRLGLGKRRPADR